MNKVINTIVETEIILFKNIYNKFYLITYKINYTLIIL